MSVLYCSSDVYVVVATDAMLYFFQKLGHSRGGADIRDFFQMYWKSVHFAMILNLDYVVVIKLNPIS